MAETLIVLDHGDTFALVGPADRVLGHLSTPRLPDLVPAPLRGLGDRLVARLVTTARAPGHPGAATAARASVQVGHLEAFDGAGRPVALRRVRGQLSTGEAGSDADPEAVLARLRRVIEHVNAEAMRPKPGRTTVDETLLRRYLEWHVLPLAEPPTFPSAVNLLYDSRYTDPAREGERLLRRTPLARLTPAVESTIGSLRPGQPRFPDVPPPGDTLPDPPDAVPHRSGWFHNLWHAATGTS